LLAIPLCILYELAIIAIWFTQRRRDRQVESEKQATVTAE
jgi:sec-independent protein translocase protein TatC